MKKIALFLFVFFQLNLLSLIGYYSPKVQEKAKQLVNLNQINFGDSLIIKNMYDALIEISLNDSIVLYCKLGFTSS